MKSQLLFFFVILSLHFSAQNDYVFGKITNEDRMELSGIMIINVDTNQKSFSDNSGNFSIKAQVGQELRFVSKNYERVKIVVNEKVYSSILIIKLIRLPFPIEEVRVGFYPSGDLKKDAKTLAKEDKVQKLKEEIGLPKGPEKPREKPAELKKDILFPMIGIPPTLNIQAVYDVLSGKARRQKSLFNYEDLQDNILWIRNNLGDEYFSKLGIPKDKIPEFIFFAISSKPEIKTAIKQNNPSKIMVQLEEILPIFLKRLKITN